MTALNLQLDRLNITLHGVSAEIAQAAVADLGSELRRRLSRLPPQLMSSLDIGVLALGPLHLESVLDAAALRGLIAERLMQALFEKGRAQQPTEEVD